MLRLLSRLSPPGEQLTRRQTMSSSNSTHRYLAAITLRDNLVLLLVAPITTAARASENLKPLHTLIGLGAMRKPCNRHMSKPCSGTTSTISRRSGRWEQNSAYSSAPHRCNRHPSRRWPRVCRAIQSALVFRRVRNRLRQQGRGPRGLRSRLL